jgi:hypothetical protein
MSFNSDYMEDHPSEDGLPLTSFQQSCAICGWRPPAWAYLIDAERSRFRVFGKEYTLPDFWTLCHGCAERLEALDIDAVVELKLEKNPQYDDWDREKSATSVRTFAEAKVYRKSLST